MADKREVRFNVNENVRVRLTDFGRSILQAENDRMNALFPDAKFHLPDDSNGGWTKWQLWSLMQTFGPHICMGMDTPFETEILIEFPEAADEITRLNAENERLTKEADDLGEQANRWRNAWGESQTLVDEMREGLAAALVYIPSTLGAAQRARALITKASRDS